MKFTLHEIKLWFKNKTSEPKSYYFLPNKVNVITGDATTGKTSFWSIIDYCLLSSKINIANTINDKVLWFGIRFTINGKEISIVREAPHKGTSGNDVYFNYGNFSTEPKNNKTISEIKSILDTEFGITDKLRFPYGKNRGRTSFNISYRYFLLFNSLTETIIGAPETYFDTTFYGKSEYDEALSHIFDLVIGVNDMEKIKAIEDLEKVKKRISNIETQIRTNERNLEKHKSNISQLVDKCKEFEFIEYANSFKDVEEENSAIQQVINTTIKRAENEKLFLEIDNLNKQKREIQTQINAINQYKREYAHYKKNLRKSADSLQPIEFLKNQLSDQIVNSYETKLFIDSLSFSLKKIKSNISKKVEEPLKVEGDTKKLTTQLTKIDEQIKRLDKIKKNYQAQGTKFIVLGEIKNEYEQIVKSNKYKPIDTIKLNELNEEKNRLEKVPDEMKQIQFLLKNKLDKSIQRNYNKLTSLPTYKDSSTIFNEDTMILQLVPEGQLFPLDNVGSKSNYMFMHLCFYLGLHEHLIKEDQLLVPQFLFIDQPSIPYYTDNDEKGNNDKDKLIDAFTLLNSFIEYITVELKDEFQIFMIEHASKEYWEENNLSHFHLVDEFLNGKGLIPSDVYNAKN